MAHYVKNHEKWLGALIDRREGEKVAKNLENTAFLRVSS